MDTKTNKTLVNVVLDRSGSMQSCRASTISGYNEYLKGLRADTKTEYSLSLIEFDSPVDGPELTVKYLDKSLVEVQDLTEADFEPRGMTPLYDGIGECIRRVEAKERLVITVIITDGMENASREFTQESIKALIAEKESKEHWTFAFLGANIDSYAAGGAMGVTFSGISNYVVDQATQMFRSVADSTVNKSYVAATCGLTASAAAPMFSTTQRASMGDHTTSRTSIPRPPIQGGRPAAPRRFPSRSTVPSRRTRTNWKTSGSQ